MQENKIQFYGRKKGRKLSKEKNKIVNLLGPQIFIKKSNLNTTLNHSSEKIYLEIGFGCGENLLNLSKIYPESIFFGAEPYINSYVKLMQKIYKEQIKNIKIWPDDVRLIMSCFENSFFDKIFILHPDPWQKKKHKKRRIVQQDFLDALSRVLKRNGTIILSTDEKNMKSWILEQFHIREDFEWQINHIKEIFNKPDNFVESKYSKKAQKGKKTINWFFFKKK